jgi:metallo-beta-lactamase family protein
MVKITFEGAAGTVTGSCYLVETENSTFIVDCGMFQGPDVEARNLDDYEFDPSKVDFVLLTHSHMDHSGMLPKLVKHGFNGPIYATNHTIQITTELLYDSAKIQENNYSRGEFYGKFTKLQALVYDTNDAQKTISLFKAVSFDDEFDVNDSIKAKFIKAGHILGAASIEVTINDEGKEKTILFSGDIGRVNSTIIDTFDPDYKSTPDYILMESLYGGEVHPTRTQSVQELIDIIKRTINNGGNVFIPVFAVERAQEILNDFKIAKQSGALPNDIPVWLDSPLAQRITNIYTQALQHSEDNIFDFPNLRYVTKYRQSLKLTNKKGNIILAGSGMADGGRIMTHLTTGLEDKKNAVIFVGYQAVGTLGRELVEGAETVIIGENRVRVKATVYYLHGFSAHGDTNDYMAWLKRHISGNLKRILLIHAEEDRASAMKKIIEDEKIDHPYVPEWKETMEL